MNDLLKKTCHFFIALVVLTCIDISIVDAQSLWKHGRLKTTADGHYLQFEDGTPFFWLGDTGWELFERLTLEEIKTYLDNRSAKGMNVIQAVALAEFDGIRRPNRYGQLPLIDNNPDKPNSQYFTIIDSTVKMALSRNMFIGLLPTWGDKVTLAWGEGPVIFDSANAYRYGKWIGQRYADYPNIIWILGGDRPAVNDKNDWRPVWRQMAKGIKEGTRNRCIITYHPSGGSNSTSQWIHHESWLDINMFQSGHGGGHDTPCWQYVTRDRSYTPTKPTLDAEPNYEDHPVNPWPKWNPDNGYYRDYDVRKQLYRSVFAGACGVTYGHHAIWQFMSEREATVNYPDRGWVNAMDRPGAFQAGYLRKLIETRFGTTLLPDSNLIMEGQGEKAFHMEACYGADGSYIMVYLPVGKQVGIQTKNIKASQLNIWWFNPSANQLQSGGTIINKGTINVTSPTTGVGNDWVLIIEDSKKPRIPANTVKL
ncbi:MAG: glycoside hydrolase family 140 protein [Agriterribacter sp.]